MPEKHYNINYLEGTALILKNIKENSYKPFTAVKEGKVVDLGCGPGIDAINLSSLLGEKVHVTGIDHDPVMIEKARSSASGVSNIDFVIAEAYPVPFEDEAIEGARAERLLQHLQEPEVLTKEVYRVLKPEGSFVVVETDWSSLSFYNADRTTAGKVNEYLTDKKVKNGAVARQLTGLLHASGFKDITLEIYPFVVRSVREIYAYLLIDQSLKEMLDKGFLSASEYNSFVHSLEEAESKGFFSCTLNLVIASGKK